MKIMEHELRQLNQVPEAGSYIMTGSRSGRPRNLMKNAEYIEDLLGPRQQRELAAKWNVDQSVVSRNRKKARQMRKDGVI